MIKTIKKVAVIIMTVVIMISTVTIADRRQPFRQHQGTVERFINTGAN